MNKIDTLVRNNIRSLKSYSSARKEYAGASGIFLDANENPIGVYNRYPDPDQQLLKEKLAALKQVAAENVFIGNGSDEVIDLAYRIFCEPGRDKALTFTPTYGMYEVSAAINNVDLIQLPLTIDHQLDLKSLKPYFQLDRLKLIFICSPNNPTGNLLSTEAIGFILDQFKGIVVIDEAYIDFCAQRSFIERLDQYPRLLVIQTLSKAWGMAGARIGVAYAHPTIIAYYNKIKPPYNVSALNQQAALDGLNRRKEFLHQVQMLLNEKKKLITALQSLSLVKKVWPSDANFLLVEVEDANGLYQALVEQQIIVRNRSAVLKNCLRITIGTAEENQQLITAMKNINYV